MVKPEVALTNELNQVSKEIGLAIAPLGLHFFDSQMKKAIMVSNLSKSEFKVISSDCFITEVDKYVNLYEIRFSKSQGVVKRRVNLSSSMAKVVLECEDFKETLPSVCRLFSVPQPILFEGKIVLPEVGYDETFLSFMPENNIKIQEIPLEKAHEIIEDIFSEVNFDKDSDGKLTKNGQTSKIHAIAALMTPFLRGLYPNWNDRTPFFFYIGNRPRVGKDYLAGVTGILYEGHAIEFPAISWDEKGNNSNEELRKIMTSAIAHGSRRIHFSNNKGKLDCPELERTLTAKVIEDRLLGRNEIIKLSNEVEFSGSGNVGISFSEDMRNRCRFIELEYSAEDINGRVFKRQDLHGWVLAHRSEILSALYSFIKEWERASMPQGKSIIASFPEWSRVCGGIMEVNALGNPCEVISGDLANDTDQSADIKKLFELLYAKFHDNATGYDDSFTKAEIMNLVEQWQSEWGIFSRLNFNDPLKERSVRTSLAMEWKRNVKREYSGYGVFVIPDVNVGTPREKYRMKKVF